MIVTERRKIVLEAAAAFEIELPDEIVDLIVSHPDVATANELQLLVFRLAIFGDLRRTAVEPAWIEEALQTVDAPNAPDVADDEPPLIMAIEDGDHEELAELLAEPSVDLEVTSRRHDGMTPLLVALSQRDPRMAKMLLDAGARPSNSGEFSASPIHEACANLACLRLVLAAGANPNELMEDALTPLMLVATDDGQLERAQLLLDAGADPRPINKHGETALSIAEENGATEIASLLRRHQA